MSTVFSDCGVLVKLVLFLQFKYIINTFFSFCQLGRNKSVSRSKYFEIQVLVNIMKYFSILECVFMCPYSSNYGLLYSASLCISFLQQNTLCRKLNTVNNSQVTVAQNLSVRAENIICETVV